MILLNGYRRPYVSMYMSKIYANSETQLNYNLISLSLRLWGPLIFILHHLPDPRLPLQYVVKLSQFGSLYKDF